MWFVRVFAQRIDLAESVLPGCFDSDYSGRYDSYARHDKTDAMGKVLLRVCLLCFG